MQATVNGTELAYDLSGAGRPVVLIHGWSMSRQLWKHQIAPLQANHQVLRYDLRGHGESGKPAGALRLEDHVEDLHQLLAHMGWEKATLVGWSMGATVAGAFAAHYPAQVEKLVMVEATPILVALPDFPYGLPAEAAQGFIGGLMQDYGATVRAFVENMLPDGDAAIKDWVWAETQKTSGPIAAEALGVGAVDTRATMQSINTPTFLIHSSHDAVCPPEAGRWLAQNITGARLHMIEGAGHCPFLTQPENFNQVLLAEL